MFEVGRCSRWDGVRRGSPDPAEHARPEVSNITVLDCCWWSGITTKRTKITKMKIDEVPDTNLHETG